MKYGIYLNMVKMIEWDLSYSEGVLIDLFSHLQSWAESEIIEGETWYYFSKGKILEEAPILSKSGNIDTVYRQIKGLISKGLVLGKKEKGKDYWRILPKMREWNFSEKNPNFENNSEKNPSELGKKSENDSEKNPTYNNTSINNNTSDNIFVDSEICISESSEKVLKKKMEKINFSLYLGKDGNTKESLLKDLEAFYDYWTEKNDGGKKLRWEMEKVFDVNRRFGLWMSKKKNSFGVKKQFTGFTSI